jgi:hypothetical protein
MVCLPISPLPRSEAAQNSITCLGVTLRTVFTMRMGATSRRCDVTVPGRGLQSRFRVPQLQDCSMASSDFPLVSGRRKAR